MSAVQNCGRGFVDGGQKFEALRGREIAYAGCEGIDRVGGGGLGFECGEVLAVGHIPFPVRRCLRQHLSALFGGRKHVDDDEAGVMAVVGNAGRFVERSSYDICEAFCKAGLVKRVHSLDEVYSLENGCRGLLQFPGSESAASDSPTHLAVVAFFEPSDAILLRITIWRREGPGRMNQFRRAGTHPRLAPAPVRSIETRCAGVRDAVFGAVLINALDFDRHPKLFGEDDGCVKVVGSVRENGKRQYFSMIDVF